MNLTGKLVGLAVAVATTLTLTLALPSIAGAQGSEPKAANDQKAGDKREGVPKRIDDIAEIGRVMTGPAANPECVWLGRRVISLLWRDDLDTAFRHLDLYDRFGCPGGQIQATFRCVVRQGDIDPKATETVNARIHACWINPSLQPPPPPAAAAETNPPAPAPTAGTNAK
jgi:hypothetical protein